MQPAPVSYRCRVASYIGFAHLLRRRAFHEVGGYREELHFYGEEKGLCAAFLRAGYQVVYLPDVLVAHVQDPAGRSTSRYLRYVVRNDCLWALHYLPWLAACINLPVRLARYFLMKRGSPVRDPGGAGGAPTCRSRPPSPTPSRRRCANAGRRSSTTRLASADPRNRKACT
jgi:hypothetical protein